MSATITDFDSARVKPYLVTGITGFLNDPPDSDFQRGYLAAMIAVYREGIGHADLDERICAAERLLSSNRR